MRGLLWRPQLASWMMRWSMSRAEETTLSSRSLAERSSNGVFKASSRVVQSWVKICAMRRVLLGRTVESRYRRSVRCETPRLALSAARNDPCLLWKKGAPTTRTLSPVSLHASSTNLLTGTESSPSSSMRSCNSLATICGSHVPLRAFLAWSSDPLASQYLVLSPLPMAHTRTRGASSDASPSDTARTLRGTPTSVPGGGGGESTPRPSTPPA
mmetsp:Transcript_30933/g.78343  ORF Transcript_30933/g.78343 Transcript_30933/m.78343 type:complete len:213 (-) Transcript_30933:511-1149(-)